MDAENDLAVSDEAQPEPALRPAWEREGTVCVVGVDGLTLDLIEPMAERGELPAFSRLAERGCYGALATISPTNSSLLWTSIATGRHHDDHGIDGFQFYEVCGIHLSRSALRKYGRWGLRLLIALPKLLGLRKKYHFDGRHIRARPFWEVVSESGGRVGVVNWWHSWPARPVNGFLVSDRLHYWRAAWRGKPPVDTHLVYPESLMDQIGELIVPPEEVSAEEVAEFVHLPLDQIRRIAEEGSDKRHPVVEVRFLLSADRTYSRVFRQCRRAFGELQLAAIYFRGPDIAQHCAFEYLPSSVASEATEGERKAFGEVVPRAYRFADHLVGQLLDQLRPEDSLLLVSDHGYGRQKDAGRHGPYGHAKGEPPGVIYACGRGFRRGARIEDACIYDVAPTALRMCGLPVARDLEGRCLEELVTEDFRKAHPVPEPVETYG
ncbi:MAG: alkaline phosphatase family protein, partial [Candidatus Brocadiaceae bacterium]